MPRKEARGRGITAREVTLFDAKDPADAAAMMLWFDSLGEELRAKGLWGAATHQMRAACEGIMQSQPDRGHQPDSPRDFAQKILRSLELADHAILEGQAELAARLALDAGQLWATAVMKWSWEADALRGEKVVGGARNSARKNSEKLHAPIRLVRMGRMEELVPQFGPTRAAAMCETEGLGPMGAIQRQWTRWKSKDT